jgi:hypothetical protein
VQLGLCVGLERDQSPTDLSEIKCKLSSYSCR